MPAGMFTLGVAEREGFVSAYLIRLPNGLILRTAGRPLEWTPKEEREGVRRQMGEFAEWLKQAGAEIVGKHVLEEDEPE